MEESHMLRFHRLASAAAVALVTVALLAPVAQARPAVSGSASGGGSTSTDRIVHDTPLAAPVDPLHAPAQSRAVVATSDRASAEAGTDWNAVFAGAAGSALIIAMCAGGVGLVRRSTLAA
jgi:hypothetical protein